MSEMVRQRNSPRCGISMTPQVKMTVSAIHKTTSVQQDGFREIRGIACVKSEFPDSLRSLGPQNARRLKGGF